MVFNERKGKGNNIWTGGNDRFYFLRTIFNSGKTRDCGKFAAVPCLSALIIYNNYVLKCCLLFPFAAEKRSKAQKEKKLQINNKTIKIFSKRYWHPIINGIYYDWK